MDSLVYSKKQLMNETRAKRIASNILVPVGFIQRMRGLIGKPFLGNEEAMLLEHCNWILTLFMHFPIDVIFVNDGWQVVALRSNVRPYRVLRPYLQAKHTIELAVGVIEKSETKLGDQLTWV